MQRRRLLAERPVRHGAAQDASAHHASTSARGRDRFQKASRSRRPTAKALSPASSSMPTARSCASWSSR
jgi:hypothetical protein